MSDRTTLLLKRIVEYCIKIEEAQKNHFPDRKAFDEDVFFRDGCAFYIQQIGETVKDLPEEFLSTHQEVKWHQVKGFRTVIAHAYESVDPDILWEAIQLDIPKLKKFCLSMLSEDLLKRKHVTKDN